MRDTPTYRAQGAPKDRCYLLQRLQESAGSFVSGTELSESLKISRTAVWFKIQALKEAGFEIDAMPQRGYKIDSLPNVLHAILLGEAAKARDLQAELLYYPVLDSTNNEAERQLAKGRPAPFAILSGQQTAGRGRRQRKWHSESKDNLYLTVAFDPQMPANQLQHFTLWSGIYLCRALQKSLPETDLQIKWPNDLYGHGRKFAGMLTEARIDAEGLNTLLFGFGLNVNSDPKDYPEEIHEIATSLLACKGSPLPLNELAVVCVEAILQAYETCIQNTDATALRKAWEPLDCLAGKPVRTESHGSVIEGTARGIDDSGALRIEDAAGKIHLVHAGDVTLARIRV